MKRPPHCCHLPTFVIAWDTEATEVTLDTCSCWPNGEEVDGAVVWSGSGNGDTIVHAAKWVLRWAEGRGAHVTAVTEREVDRAEANAHGTGVLVMRVAPIR